MRVMILGVAILAMACGEEMPTSVTATATYNVESSRVHHGDGSFDECGPYSGYVFDVSIESFDGSAPVVNGLPLAIGDQVACGEVMTSGEVYLTACDRRFDPTIEIRTDGASGVVTFDSGGCPFFYDLTEIAFVF